MTVLVDTSVWSLALRKREPNEKEQVWITELEDLIHASRIAMIGPIRQEVLSGIYDQDIFLRLKKSLSSFPDLQLSSADFERAAEYANHCRQNGIQGSHTDFLICSVASFYNIEIFTLDKDFTHFAKYLDIHLFSPRYLA